MNALRRLLLQIIDGDEVWARLRLLLVVLCLLVVGAAMGALEVFVVHQWKGDVWPAWFSLTGLRHLWVPFAALAFAIGAGVLYVEDVFELGHLRQALRFLVASMFGLAYPTLVVRNGEPDRPSDEAGTLEVIGGPGCLDIRLGNGAVLEHPAGRTAVRGAGWHFVPRFFSIRSLLDLREQHRQKDVNAVTRDGIEITLRDAEATFHLRGDGQSRTEADPYPLSNRAARDSVYNLSANRDGEVGNWADFVMRRIGALIGDWVARQRLDRLTAPSDGDPREAIREFLREQAERLSKMLGVEIVRVNIGHLDTPAEVDRQRADSWGAFWQSHTKVTLAHGDAVRVAYEELGRAEGQAAMIAAIAGALESSAPGLPDDRLPEHVLLRVARVLESLTAPPGLGEMRLTSAQRQLTGGDEAAG